jgi:hypothetical protein
VWLLTFFSSFFFSLLLLCVQCGSLAVDVACLVFMYGGAQASATSEDGITRADILYGAYLSLQIVAMVSPLYMNDINST